MNVIESRQSLLAAYEALRKAHTALATGPYEGDIGAIADPRSPARVAAMVTAAITTTREALNLLAIAGIGARP